MNGKTMRIMAGCAALLLVLVYAFVPVREMITIAGNSGRTKLELEEGEKNSWPWTPETSGNMTIDIRIAGTKKAEGITLHGELTDENGVESVSSDLSGAELTESEQITLQGNFSHEKKYLLSLWTEGGSLKVRGSEDEETEEFYPALTVSYETVSRNPVLLYFACGALMIALTPIWEMERVRTVRQVRKKWSNQDRWLFWSTFVMLATLGIFISIIRPAKAAWFGLPDESIHAGRVAAMSLFDEEISFPMLAASLITWNPAYIPCAIGYNLGQIFSTDPEVWFRMGTIFNTMAYSLLCALAVTRAPRYKATFLVVTTMPKMPYFMASFTYDIVVIGSILLGTSLLLEAIEGGERITSAKGITLISLLAFGTVAKPAYSVALLILWMIPWKQFGGKKEAWLFRGFVFLMFCWCMISMLMPGAYDYVISGDSRFDGHISSSEQLAYMLENPIEGGLKPVRYVWENRDWLMKDGISTWVAMGSYEIMNKLWLWLLLAVAPLCTIGENWDHNSVLTPGRRIGLGCIATGAVVMLAYAQYLASSEVSGALRGMQARYFVPVWIAMALAFMWPHRIRRQMDRAKKWMILGVFMVCLAGNWWNTITHLIAEGLL